MREEQHYFFRSAYGLTNISKSPQTSGRFEISHSAVATIKLLNATR